MTDRTEAQGLRAALVALIDATEAPFPSSDHGADAQTAWAKRRADALSAGHKALAGAPPHPSDAPQAQPAAAVQVEKPQMTLTEFCAEADRIGLTAATLAAQLATRPEFADCVPATSAEALAWWLVQYRLADGWHDACVFASQEDALEQAEKYTHGRVVPASVVAAPTTTSTGGGK